MNTLEILQQAVNSRKSISFEYNREGKVRGERIGNPHAVFIFTAKSGEQSTKVHIVQTDGVSDSRLEKPFPDFRMFNIEELDNVKILENSSQFPVNEKYNPEWEGYANVIVKV
jgi:hypothetical protein